MPQPTRAEGPAGSTAEAASISSPDLAGAGGDAAVAVAADVVAPDWSAPPGAAGEVPAAPPGTALSGTALPGAVWPAFPPGAVLPGGWSGAGACWLPVGWPVTGVADSDGTGCGAEVVGATGGTVGRREARWSGPVDGAGAVDVGGDVL